MRRRWRWLWRACVLWFGVCCVVCVCLVLVRSYEFVSVRVCCVFLLRPEATVVVWVVVVVSSLVRVLTLLRVLSSLLGCCSEDSRRIAVSAIHHSRSRILQFVVPSRFSKAE